MSQGDRCGDLRRGEIKGRCLLPLSSIDTVTHASLYSSLYAAHQRYRADLPLVFEEERPVRKPADKVIAPVLLDNPVLSHADIMT